MNTLLIRLAAPLQSWGIESKFDTRRTAREPSKSGVIGLVAASLGIKRYEDDKICELSKLRLGVRVDKEGVLVKDYQTVDGGKSKYVTYRHYLSDAVFVVGLESEDIELLAKIEEALAHPAYPLFLGRRSCPPTGRLCMGIRNGSLHEVLADLEKVPLQYEYSTYNKPQSIRIVMDSDDVHGGSIVRDVPVSFSPEHRKFTFRRVCESLISCDIATTDHDPMEELG